MMRFDEHGGLAMLHRVALLYLEVAAGAERLAGAVAVHEVTARLRRQQPHLDPALISHVVRDAALSCREEAAGGMLNEAIDDAERRFSEAQRRRMLYDLADLAGDDGTAAAEAYFLRRVAEAWHLEAPTNSEGKERFPAA